jgi:hypothetical protein
MNSEAPLPVVDPSVQDCFLWKPGMSNQLSTQRPADPAYCRAAVPLDDRWPRWNQCSRKPKVWYEVTGVGKCGFCTTHDPAKIRERRVARDRKDAASFRMRVNEMKYRERGPAFADALREIAKGHNDARSFAREILEKWKEPLE